MYYLGGRDGHRTYRKKRSISMEEQVRVSFKSSTIILLAAAFPVATWAANVTGSPTLAANTALSLDTGATSASGGDFLWSGTTIAPQGKAGAYDLGSSLAFSSVTQTILSSFPTALFSSSVLKPAINDVIAFKTNGGNLAAVQVTAISGTSLSIQFITFVLPPGPPIITAVENNYSFLPAGFPNSGIAPSTLFVVIGTGLSDPTKTVALQDSTQGLPSTLNGTSVKVTVGGTTVTPAFYYAISTALALVLPANTPVGTAQITVSYNNQSSSAFSFKVVQTAPGFAPYALNPATYGYYSYGNSIPPGTTVILYGSGLGADPATDNTYVGAAFSINSLAHIYVGGVDAPIQYQGSFDYPGLNQINVTIPTNAPTGCNVPLVGLTTGGLPTNFITIPIGNGPCSDPAFGLSGSVLQSLSGQATVKSGIVGITQSTIQNIGAAGSTTTAGAFASFQSYTGSSFGSGSSTVSVGGCSVTQTLTSSSVVTVAGLDAGTVSLAGPGANLSLMSIPTVPGFYSAQLTGPISSGGGTFTFSGTGGTTAGASVGAFKTTIVFPIPLLAWTNQSAAATITRANGLSVAWTGGASGTIVTITGSSASNGAVGAFTCVAPVGAGQFTVPAYVLSALPAGTGTVVVANNTGYQQFTATGLDIGFAEGYISFGVNSTYN